MTELARGIWASAVYYSAIVFDGTTLMPFATVMVIGGGIWWLGRKLQSLEDGQITINRQLDNLPCDRYNKLSEQITDLKVAMRVKHDRPN